MSHPLAGCIGCMRTFSTQPPCDHQEIRWSRLDVYDRVGICAGEGCALWIPAWDAGALTSDQVKRALTAARVDSDLDQAPSKMHYMPSYGQIAARINQRVAWFNAQKGAH